MQFADRYHVAVTDEAKRQTEPSGEDRRDKIKVSGGASHSIVAEETRTIRYFVPPSEVLLGDQDREPRLASMTVTRRSQIDTEDIIAIGAGIVAVLFGVGMLMSWIPISALTISVVTFSAVTPVIAQIVKARRS